MPPRWTQLALLLLALLLAGCDNVARAFDPDGSQKGKEDGTGIQAAVIGGNSLDGRPKVLSAHPKGAGWPATVPILVVFNESMGEDSVVPPGNSGGQPRVYVRAKGTTTVLPASYDFLLGGTVVLIRPSAPLSTGTGGGGNGPPPPAPAFEVVVDPEARDADGIRFGGNDPKVVAEFTADQDPNLADGQILATLPEHNARNVQRETPIYTVFTKPPVASSLTSTTFFVRPAGGNALQATISTPLRMANVADPRIARIDTNARLASNTKHELVVTDAIQFGTTGKLDFGNRTPFASFTTLWPAAPMSVTVGNVPFGFPDQVNRDNLETLAIDVELDDSAAAGDDLLVRIYGLEPKTKDGEDIAFVERAQRLFVSGPGTFTVSFTDQIGKVDAPRFSEGPLTIAVLLARGAGRTGWILADSDNEPRLDVTKPTILTTGPPGGSTPHSIVTDQEHLVFHGTASERLKQAQLSTMTGSAGLYASDAGGRFTMQPIFLGRRTAAIDYSLDFTDRSGNAVAMPLEGLVEQRGVVTGSVSPTGRLEIEAYDEATLAPLSGATVVIEPGMPAKPATGRRSAVTGASGRVTFAGLFTSRHTITVVHNGYHLRTLLDTPAGFVSLPVRPQANATATLSGSVVFAANPGQSARVSSNLFDDAARLEIAPAGSPVIAIPPTAIRPGRLQLVTAFAGLFEPVATPTFGNYACSMCGVNGSTPTPAIGPVDGGQTTSQALGLLPATGTVLNLAGSYTIDFAAATGLDTGNLAGRPATRIVGSLKGLSGMSMFGTGFATLGTGASYAVTGSYSLASVLALVGFSPALWVSTEAVDRNGNISRHRQLVVDYTIGTTFPTVPPPGIGTVTAPGGPTVGAPSVTFEDRLDPAALLGGYGFLEMRIGDAAGRQWSILRNDTDGAGSEAWQVPDLTGTGLLGLATGSWTIGVDSHLLFSSTFTANSYVLEEIRRQQVAWSRAAPKTFVVN